MDVCTDSSTAVCLKECLCQREPVFRARQVHCVEVEDEPSHPELFRTPWVRVYAGILATGNCTLYHRHRRDTLYLTLRDACLWNEYFVDPSLQDARTEVYRHDARRHEVFGRWHARDRTPLVHRVCYRRENAEQGLTTSGSASPTSLFVGIEFLEYPSAFCGHKAASVQSIAAVAERIPEPVCDRMRLWCLRKGVSALQLPFSGILVDWNTPLDERWNTTDIAHLTALTKERVRFFQAGENMRDLVVGTLVVELRPYMETSEDVLPNQA
ncbi:hypothetical protein CCYA_CCYA17G4292 [Cyanidiococcus yangmingshanensis]|nr:hypothetical protein CCYA_CCYA17G4292 [Cyanidiococcus yangmingshanensis]